METKTVKPILVVSSSVKTTIQNLTKNVGDLPARFEGILKSAGIEATGAQIWEYHSLSGTMDGDFLVNIAVPINKKFDAPAGFECKELPEFQCVTEIHKGAWSDLGKTYEALVGKMMSSGKKHGSVSREIYLHCDFENQANCITEIQMQIN